MRWQGPEFGSNHLCRETGERLRAGRCIEIVAVLGLKVSGRVSVGELPELGGGRGEVGAGQRASRVEREAGRGAQEAVLSSSHAGQFAASGEAHWRISNIGAGLQLP